MSDDEHPRTAEPAGVRLAHEIRRRRTEAGLSQPQLARKIGYTRQYVSLVERPDHNLPSAEIVKAIDHALNTGGALTALREEGRNERERLRGRSVERREEKAGEPLGIVARGQRYFGEGPSAVAPGAGAWRYVAALVDRLHRDYQASRYDEVVRSLPTVLETVNAVVDASSGGRRRQALSLQCQAAIVAVKVATKTGDGIAAYEAAEKARATSEAADDVFGHASAACQLTCALLRLDAADEAEQHTLATVETLRGNPHSRTWRGMLTLISAVIAARRHDPTEARKRLEHAEWCAAALGHDGNIGFTAFGPTNVRIHRVSAAVCVGDPHRVLTEAAAVDITRLPPGLHGRQSRFHLDNAWAHTRLRQDALAVIHLLETERTAPQVLRTDPTGRSLVRELMARERRLNTPALRGLAQRTGVLA